nr:tyrosine-type recombinase/integrase [uncultured Pelagimonas sp.]
MLSLWMAQDLGQEQNSLQQYERIVEHCRTLGFTYKPLSDLSDGDLVARLIATEGQPVTSAKAALGVVEKPRDITSMMFDLYREANEDKVLKKSEHQLRVWKNPFIRAQNIFIDLAGDVPIEAISRADGLALRASLLERVKSGELAANSANRITTCLSAMWNVYAKRAQITAPNPFGSLNIKEDKKNVRSPIPEEYILLMLKPGALDRLNPECRAIVHTLINTGCRPSEVIGIQPQNIRLDSNIPHIQIRPDGRDLKTQDSERDIPLCGVALEAMRQFPSGFARYADRPTTATANINKFLKNNELVPADPHRPGKFLTVYSLRHSFQDRLTGAEVPERIARDLMGHKLEGERYGGGANLEHTARILAGISH